MEAGPVGSREMGGEDVARASAGNSSGKLYCEGEWRNGAPSRVTEV